MCCLMTITGADPKKTRDWWPSATQELARLGLRLDGFPGEGLITIRVKEGMDHNIDPEDWLHMVKSAVAAYQQLRGPRTSLSHSGCQNAGLIANNGQDPNLNHLCYAAAPELIRLTRALGDPAP